MTKLPWTSRPATIALAQFAMTSEPEHNLEQALALIQEAAERKATIVALPELFRSPYFCVHEESSRDYSESLPGLVGEKLCQAAKEFSIHIVGGSIYERSACDQLFNTSLVINSSGELVGTYRKVHIPHDPAFYEMNYFTPGNEGYKVFDLGFAKVGVLICYDQWFPEAARAVALAGAEILFYPTAIGTVTDLPCFEGSWQYAWQTVQCGHAIANNMIVCAINRVGIENSNTFFWGGSFICSGFGQILAKGSEQTGLVVADVDLGHSDYVRQSWRFFESRRPTTYSALTEQHKENS